MASSRQIGELATQSSSECAFEQNRFGEFENTVYAKQDSLGLKAWTAYAVDAGVADTTRFARCVRDTTALPRVEDGLAIGQKLGVRGTPTVIINGWRFARPPYDSLKVFISDILAGRAPRAPGA